MAHSGFRSVSAAIATSGSTQDFTISGIGTPVAAMIVVTRATSATGTKADHRIVSYGVTDGTYQGGIAGGSQDNVASSNTCRVGFDDSIVRLPLADGSGFDCQLTFNSFITDGLRVNLSDLPAAGYIADVTLWYGADCDAKAGASNPLTEALGSTHITTTFAPDQLLTLCSTNGSDETITSGLMLQVGMFANGFTGRSFFSQSEDAQATMHPTAVTANNIASFFSGNTSPFTYGQSTNLDSFDATGFNISSSGGGLGAGPSFVWLAISYGGKSFRLDLVETITAAGDQTLSGWGFDGEAGMTLQTIAATGWSGNDISTNRAGAFGIGTFSALESNSSATTEEDEAADANTSSRHTQKALSMTDHDGSTLIYEASFVEWVSGGVKLNYSTANATRRKFALFILQGQRIYVSGIASAEAFGTPVLTSLATLSPSGIASAEAFGTATLTAGAVIVLPSGIASAEAFGSATLAATITVSPSGIASAEAFGTAALSSLATISPSGVASAEAFGTATLSSLAAVSPSSIDSAEAFGTPTLSSLATVSPSGIASAEAFGTTTLVAGAVTVSPSSIASDEAFGTPTLTPGVATINPASIDSAEAFGTPTLSAGIGTINPASIASAEAFGTPTLTAGAVTVSPSGIGSEETFGAPTLFQAITVSPSSITSDEAFGTPTLFQAITVSPSSIASDEAFGTPTLAAGAVMVSPNGIDSAEAWSLPELLSAITISPSSIDSDEAWGLPELVLATTTQTILVGSIFSGESWGLPELDFLDRHMCVIGIRSEEAWGLPSLLVFLDTLFPEGIQSEEAWGYPFLSGGLIMATLKKRIHDALRSSVELGTFIVATYDSETGELVQGLQAQPASIEVNETGSAYAVDSRHGREFSQDFTEWRWLVIVRFNQEVICEPWVRSLLSNPVRLCREPGEDRQVRLLVLDAKIEHPPREGASNGTKAEFRFQAELSAR